MSRIHFILIAFLMLPALTSTAIAYDEQVKRPEHYVAKKPKNDAEALESLSVHINKIAGYLDNQPASDADMEKIHKASYSLEAAVDKLRESVTAKQELSLDLLDESVQALHYASEEHQEKETREWFKKMTTANTELQNAY